MSKTNPSRLEPSNDLLGPAVPAAASGERPPVCDAVEHDSLEQRPCIHCTEPTWAAADVPPQEVFCCSGCRGAYQLINGWGLGDYYAIRDQLKQTGASSRAGQRGNFDAFDTDQFLGDSAPQLTPDGHKATRLAIHGLHCGACAWLIENAAKHHDGWSLARVRMSDHTLQIVFDPQQTKLSAVAKLLDDLGYQLAPLVHEGQNHFQRESRRLLVQIAIAGFCAANAMWIAIALYAGEATWVAAEHRSFLRWFGVALGLVAVVGPGRTFFIGAWASIKTGTPHMDLPVAVGLLVGTVAGIVGLVSGNGEVYFDSLAVLVFLLLVGRWIQFQQQQRAARSVELLLRITPRHAKRLLTDGQTEDVLVDVLSAGDTIRVDAGESIPVDGVVVRGTSAVDRSLLTGESEPITTEQGDEVAAGTINITRGLEIRVQAKGDESRIGRIMQSVEAAAQEKVPIVQLADRIGGVFVVVVTLLALITFAYWCRVGSWSEAASHATSLLIVACPCALALATPLAIAVAIGRAARQRILIRDGTALQQLSRPGLVFFDKTGTLTEGRPRVVQFAGDVEALAPAAAVERHCAHPVASGIIGEAARRGLAQKLQAELNSVEIGGVLGSCQGQSVAIGNASFIERSGRTLPQDLHAEAAGWTVEGISPVFIALDNVVVAALGITDPQRAHAKEVLDTLNQCGWQTSILSGDQPETVAKVAKLLGLEPEAARGGLSPEQKLDIVREARSAGAVAMIGDGANDAAALAAADVGVAVRGGAEISLQAAPIYIATGKLESIPALILGAQRTQRLIYLTFAVSLTYNLFAVVLAMTGRISPLLAAILMPISSVSVLALTLAWRTFTESDS